MITINPKVSIAEEELTFTATRSSGPGGQNVNKLNTRVTLFFDLAHSPSLSEEEKERIRLRLSGRISSQGVLRVVCQRHRSQLANRREAVARFAKLLGDALAQPAARHKTSPPPRAKARRREEKERRSQLKRSRAQSDSWEE